MAARSDVSSNTHPRPRTSVVLLPRTVIMQLTMAACALPVTPMLATTHVGSYTDILYSRNGPFLILHHNFQQESVSVATFVQADSDKVCVGGSVVVCSKV